MLALFASCLGFGFIFPARLQSQKLSRGVPARLGVGSVSGFVASFPQELWDFFPERFCGKISGQLLASDVSSKGYPARSWRCIFPARFCDQMSGEVLALSFSGEVSRQVFRRVSGKLTRKWYYLVGENLPQKTLARSQTGSQENCRWSLP